MSESKEDILEGGSQGEMGEGFAGDEDDMGESKNVEAGAKDEEEEYYDPDNVKRVAFTPARVKHVISHHKSSILANDGPLVELSAQSKERIHKVFSSMLEEAPEGDEGEREVDPDRDPTRLPVVRLGDLMMNAQITTAESKEAVDRAVDELVDRKLDGNDVDVEAACRLAERFQNPAYEYGQRLRRYAGRGCAADVSRILARGCNANTADGEGLTALHYASEFNTVEVIAAIREVAGGALIVDARCKYGWTPLHCACHHGNPESVDMLLDMGASLEVSNNVAKTPLHMAAAQGRTEICEKLLHRGANVNAVDIHGMTPAHDAAYKGHVEAYRALVAADADESLLDELSNTAKSYFQDNTGIQEELSVDLTSDMADVTIEGK